MTIFPKYRTGDTVCPNFPSDIDEEFLRMFPDGIPALDARFKVSKDIRDSLYITPTMIEWSRKSTSLTIVDYMKEDFSRYTYYCKGPEDAFWFYESWLRRPAPDNIPDDDVRRLLSTSVAKEEE